MPWQLRASFGTRWRRVGTRKRRKNQKAMAQGKKSELSQSAGLFRFYHFIIILYSAFFMCECMYLPSSTLANQKIAGLATKGIWEEVAVPNPLTILICWLSFLLASISGKFRGRTLPLPLSCSCQVLRQKTALPFLHLLPTSSQ